MVRREAIGANHEGAGAHAPGAVDSTRLRSWRSATDNVVRSSTLPSADLGEDLPRPSDGALVGTRPLLGRAAVGEHVAGEVGQGGEQIVAHGGAGVRLPAVGSRQRADRVPQPRDAQMLEQVPVRRRRFLGRATVLRRQFQQVERRVHQRPDRRPFGEISGHTGNDPFGGQCRRLLGERSADERRQAIEEELHARAESGDRLLQRQRRPAVTEQPHHGALGHPPEIEEQPELRRYRDGATDRFDLVPEGDDAEDVAGGDPRSDHVDRGRPGLFGHAVVEADAGEVDHLVHDVGEDDLAPQPVVEDRRAEALADRPREVANEVRLEIRIVGERRGRDVGDVGHLRVGEQHRELGRGEPSPGGSAVGELLLVRDELELPVEPAFALELLDVAAVDVHHRGRLHASDRQCEGLGRVVGQHELTDLVGHRRQQLVALLDGQVAGLDELVEEDLDVDLMVGAVDARPSCRWRRC